MAYLYWDTSSLVKRYMSETGSACVDRIFSFVPKQQMMLLSVFIGEVISIAVKRHNARRLTARQLAKITVTFRNDAFGDAGAQVRSCGLPLVEASLPLIMKHSLNATDAVLLRSALDVLGELSDFGSQFVLITSDARLLRAAVSEGLQVINPETDSEERVASLLSE